MVFLFILLIFLTLFIFSKIQIEILNLKYKSNSKKHLNKNYKIIFVLKILGNIPIFKTTIDKKKVDKLKKKDALQKRINEINLKVIENKEKIDKNILKAIKKANILLKKLRLKVEIGTINPFLTSILVPVISTIISILIAKNTKRKINTKPKQKSKTLKNQKYIITPLYFNQNIVNIEISGIFEIKMIHIINIIYILNKKEGVKKNERTSNRRPYDYSYE